MLENYKLEFIGVFTPHSKAPSDEGAVSEADWGREQMQYFQYFSLPPALWATSLVRGRLGWCIGSTNWNLKFMYR